MEPLPRISEAEWDVLSVLWRLGPLTASQVHAELSGRAWKLNTVRTFLTRLEAKGAVAAGEESEAKKFSARVTRASCVREASQTFLDRVFDGATGPLLVHFAKTKRLTAADLAELQAIIDRKRKEK